VVAIAEKVMMALGGVAELTTACVSGRPASLVDTKPTPQPTTAADKTEWVVGER
jgi:hypothetical protein